MRRIRSTQMIVKEVKTGMKTILGKSVTALVLSMIIAMWPIQTAFADKPTTPSYANRPNLVWNVPDRETVIVHVLNTTPYDLEYVNSDFHDFSQSHVQSTHSYAYPRVFTPSGIPHKIPSKTGATFVVSYIDTLDSKGHWDVVNNLNMTYIMRNIDVTGHVDPKACANNVTKGDVTLLLNFNRVVESQDSLKGDVFKLIVAGTSMIVSTIGMIVEPNPLPVIEFLISAQEIAVTSKEIADRSGGSDQNYFSAYILPIGNSTTNGFPYVYMTENPKDYTDGSTAAQYAGLYSQQSSSGGCPQASIVSAVMVQRDTGPSDKTLDGNMPVAFVTLATLQDWISAMKAQQAQTPSSSAAGNRISQFLKREGKNGNVAFVKLARTLNDKEFNLLETTYDDLLKKKLLSRLEEDFLAHFADALEHHAVKLPPFAMPSTVPANK